MLPENLAFNEWLEAGEKLKTFERRILWCLGDWLNYGEKQYGETYSQALDATDYSYQTLRDSAWVSGQIELSRRRDNLSFSHHKEVAALEPSDQDRFLTAAEEHSLTREELRRAVTDYKRGISREKLSLAAALTGKYAVVYADPPWQYSNSGFDSSAEAHYLTMDTSEICAMGSELAPYLTDDVVLFLWVTNPLLPDAFKVIESWGFEYKTNMAWVKDRPIGMGFYCRGQHELLLICTKGSFTPEGDLPPSVFQQPITEHSKKPLCVYDLIERMYPRGPYLELFLRGEERDRWKGFGNQAS